MDDDGCVGVIMVLGVCLLIGALFGKYYGATRKEAEYRQQAVERKYGEWYSSGPGQAPTEWRWIDPK